MTDYYTQTNSVSGYGSCANVLVLKSHKKLTEQECIEIGGHCYEIQNTVLTSNPPTYIRVCKHCGKTQHGHPQDDINWS
jgi:hypothetical protein